MTGYGSSLIKVGDLEISVVIKAVNGRFLDARFHLPKEYFPQESHLKKRLSQAIHRGTVDVFIHRRGASHLQIDLNRDVAKKWVAAHKELARSLGLPLRNEALLERLSVLPQIFDVRDKGRLHSKESRGLMAAFGQALKRCVDEKIREGRSAKIHLKGILKALSRAVRSMEKLRLEASQELEARLKDKLRRLGIEESVDPERFAQELVIYLDKSDIAEEIERLKEHVQMCEASLNTTQEMGKKLDFYSQELLREVNTIGSKANYAPLTEQVVKAKGLIESLKEQVQNIE